MLGVLPVLTYAIVTAGNPIKWAREQLSDNKGYTQKDYLVTKLPGMTENIPEPEIPLMFAGQLPLYHENNTHYFFWKFVDRQKEPRAQNKTIFWLNGGPGCLSMDGALMEVGPFRTNDRKQVTGNPGSWHRKGDIVFVDQPAGTGFSYSTEFDDKLADVLWHFITFLERYFALFPEDKDNDILLAGESFAGQYIPYIAEAILARNARTEAAEAKFNLKGLLIGNGYISPNDQGLLFIPFAVAAGMITIQHPRWPELLKVHEKCQKAVDGTINDRSANAFAIVDSRCNHVLTLLLKITVDHLAAQNAQCFNMYDYTLKDSYPSCGMNWPPDLANVNLFLAKEAVMSDLNLAFHKHWIECSASVGSHLRAKKSLPSIQLFPALLKHLQIVLFHGNRDVICNCMGAELMILELKWGGKKGFSKDIITYDWRHNGTIEGFLRSERNLTYINVYNASHMVPFDKPEASRALVDLFYRDYEVQAGSGDANPEIVTSPMADMKGLNVDLPAHNSTADSNQEKTSEQPQTSRIVRAIQLAVVVVLIWGIFAFYTTYKSRPTSIIKTRPAGRKKNVSWADELESAVKEPGSAKTLSLISKAFSKLTTKTGDVQGDYHCVDHEEIEMNEGVQDGDNFIIGSDNESEEHAESSASGERVPGVV